MKRRSRFLFFTMSVAFALCIVGVVAGMLYDLGAVYFAHRSFESVMSDSIGFNKILGALGLLGMLLFFLFLFSLVSGKAPKDHR